MSAEALRTGLDPVGEASRQAIRLALGVTAGFTLAEGLDWSFSFLPPMLAVTLLAQPNRPSLRMGLAMVLVVALAMGAALLLTAELITSPSTLMLGLGLALFLTFYAQARGAPDGPIFFLQVALIAEPVMAVVDWSLAQNLAWFMIYGVAAALLIVWTAHLVLPDQTDRAAPKPATIIVDRGPAAWQAAARTLILLPPLTWFVLDATQVSLVCLIVILTVIRRFEPGMGGKVAVGLVLGNLAGGLVAAILYNVVQMHETIVFFAVTCLAVSLIMADTVTRKGPLAPIASVAFATFILVLGLGLTPLPGGSEDTFTSRMTNVLLASLYAVGAMALVVRARFSLAPPSVQEPGGERDAGGGQGRDAPA